MLSCIKHACFHVFSPFSAYFFPHDIIAEKGLLRSNFCERQKKIALAIIGLSQLKPVLRYVGIIIGICEHVSIMRNKRSINGING